MKHQTITNLKFKTLGARIKLPLWQLVGLLEGIWLFAIFHARDGDLTRFAPEDIAAWLEYEGDAEQLITALVDTRWLDRSDDGELLIHDWDEHRPTWLKGIESRQPGSNSEGVTKSATKSVTKSHTKPLTKSATKQVGLGWVRSVRNNTSQGKRSKQFVIPTIDEVTAYCDERCNGIDAQEFLDHYQTNGWVTGKNHTPMRDWKAAVRTWERWRNERSASEPASKIVTPEEFASMGVNLSTGEGLR